MNTCDIFIKDIKDLLSDYETEQKIEKQKEPKTTKEENMRSRIEYLEQFVLRMRLYLDNKKIIQPDSEAHRDLIIMTDGMLSVGQ